MFFIVLTKTPKNITLIIEERKSYSFDIAYVTSVLLFANHKTSIWDFIVQYTYCTPATTQIQLRNGKSWQLQKLLLCFWIDTLRITCQKDIILNRVYSVYMVRDFYGLSSMSTRSMGKGSSVVSQMRPLVHSEWEVN